jgi:predicted metal-dependent hydrolase
MEDLWQKAKDLFNAGHYWECHEALEPLWLPAERLNKHFYAGVILLAAALHKARVMDSPRGGQRNYAKALAHLALIPDIYMGVEVRELESSVHRALCNTTQTPKL